jgi:biotin carboxyl carrier protein
VGLVKFSAKVGQAILEVSVERHDGNYVVEVDGVRHEVDCHKLEGDFYSILADGRSYEVSIEATEDGYRVRHGATEQLVTLSDASRRAREAVGGGTGPIRLVSLMPGKVVRIAVAEGDSVNAGQGVVVVEAMKMENEIAAPRPGRVKSIAVKPGQVVEGGAELLVIET